MRTLKKIFIFERERGGTERGRGQRDREEWGTLENGLRERGTEDPKQAL